MDYLTTHAVTLIMLRGTTGQADRMSREVVWVSFQPLTRHLRGGTDENQENRRSGYLVF
jgi:hypothetical protein